MEYNIKRKGAETLCGIYMNKMTAIIVDDEYRIGQLISKLIHFNELSISILKIFDNSMEALKFICENKPDIVISDIQMPMIDGLELIRRTIERDLHPHFILISGYREFEYARTALKYGVEDYLLKPVNEEELNKILQNVCSRHSRMQKEEEENKKLKESAKREHILNGRDALLVLLKSPYLGSIEMFNRSYRTHFQTGDFLLLSIKLDYEFIEEETSQNQFLIRTIVTSFENYFRNVVYEQLYAAVTDDEIYGLLNYETGKTDDLTESLRRFFYEIINKVESIPSYHATVAISDKCDLQDVFDQRKVIQRRISQRYCYGTNRVIAETNVSLTAYKPTLEYGLKAKLSFAAASFDNTALKEYIDDAFSTLLPVKPEEANRVSELAYDVVDCVLAEYSPTDEIRSEKERIYKRIGHCWCIENIIEVLKKELSDVVTEQERRHKTQTRKPIKEALDYIHNHYGEKITLETISDLLQINASYFSTIFKKETGENFQNYLTKFRIEKAKELLITTQDTMASIAAKVGYTDTRYFSQIFIKTVGLKPSLYRKMYA
ncbi:MAG: response regulator transcription factor [Bulleidia sp.]